MTTGDRVVTFQGHHSYLVSIAKLCKENGLFTDVTILCDDGKLVAHRIVLAAVSPFLCHVLDAATGDTPATTIIMPDVRKEIVQQLLEFLYTGIMKLSPSATWELQQLVLLLQIDPQNVGVDTIRGGLDPDKYDRLSSSVCQTLGIKIAHKADISAQHKVSPKHSPTPATKPASNVVKVPPKVSSPKSARSPPLTNGLKERLAESPKNSTPPPTNQVKHSATPTLKIVNSTLKTTLKTKGQDSKPGRKTQEKSLNPLKLSISSGSIIRANDSNDSFKQSHHLKDSQNNISSITSSVTPDSSNVIPNLKIVTRKRPLSEKIDYSEMIEEDLEALEALETEDDLEALEMEDDLEALEAEDDLEALETEDNREALEMEDALEALETEDNWEALETEDGLVALEMEEDQEALEMEDDQEALEMEDELEVLEMEEGRVVLAMEEDQEALALEDEAEVKAEALEYRVALVAGMAWAVVLGSVILTPGEAKKCRALAAE